MCYIEIDGWKANIRFSSAHILPEYDKCGRLHGHTYAIHVKIYGASEENGIVIDFRYVKNVLREIADDLDHRVLIPSENPMVVIKGDQVELSNAEKTYIFPKNDCKILPIKSTSAENLALYVFDRISQRLKKFKNIRELEVGIDEGYGQGARIKGRIK